MEVMEVKRKSIEILSKVASGELNTEAAFLQINKAYLNYLEDKCEDILPKYEENIRKTLAGAI